MPMGIRDMPWGPLTKGAFYCYASQSKRATCSTKTVFARGPSGVTVRACETAGTAMARLRMMGALGKQWELGPRSKQALNSLVHSSIVIKPKIISYKCIQLPWEILDPLDFYPLNSTVKKTGNIQCCCNKMKYIAVKMIVSSNLLLKLVFSEG